MSDPATDAIVGVLQGSSEPQDQILVKIFKSGEGNTAKMKHLGERLDVIEGQMKRLISAQMATEKLEPAKKFTSIRSVLVNHTLAICGVGAIAVIALVLHFVVISPNLVK